MIGYLMDKLGYNVIRPGDAEIMKPGERRLIPGGSKVQLPRGTTRARPGKAPVGSQKLQVMKYGSTSPHQPAVVRDLLERSSRYGNAYRAHALNQRRLLNRILRMDMKIAPSGPPLGGTKIGTAKPTKDTSALQDFLFGLDPSGRGTFAAGQKNVQHHGRHMSVGAVGGFLGGSLAIPSLVSGAVKGIPDAAKTQGGWKAKALALGRGAIAPHRLFFGGTKAVRSMKRLEQGATLKPHEWARIQKTMQAASVGDVGAAAQRVVSKGSKNQKLVNLDSILSADPTIRNYELQRYLRGNPIVPEARKAMEKGVGQAAMAMGVSGGIGAGSALIQYGAGRGVQKKIRRARRGEL